MSEDPGLVQVWLDRGGGLAHDTLAVEAPLEIQIDERPIAVLMRTPGEDLDLVAGFLVSEGIVEDPRDLKGLAHCERPADHDRVVRVTLAEGVPSPVGRAWMSSAACGLCGTARLEDLARRLPPRTPGPALEAAQVHAFVAALGRAQPRFQATGGLHGAALFAPDGTCVVAREDIGRHNAVDKVIGHCLRAHRWPLTGHHLAVSSRAGYEIVQKALLADISTLIAVGAASSLAHDIARTHGLALYSFARPGRFNRHPTD